MKLVLLFCITTLALVVTNLITYTTPVSTELSAVALRLEEFRRGNSILTGTSSRKTKHESSRNSNFNSGNFAVDIISVASLERLDNLLLQRRTFGSHPSVRNFFNATEIDDYDPLCHTELTVDQVMKVSSFCRNRPSNLSHTMKYLRGIYARRQWLEKKPNPVGWLCAIQRPYTGLKKALSHYLIKKEKLPDYLIILDDDSYYNMESFTMNYKGTNSTKPTVTAGCLVRQPGEHIFVHFDLYNGPHLMIHLLIFTQCTRLISHFHLEVSGLSLVVVH